MNRAVQLILAVVIGLATSAAFNAAHGQVPLQPATALAFTLATVLTMLASWVRLPAGRAGPAATPTGTGNREQGTVKWFNVSKGFGFIIRANGEEIFVHQRQLTTSAHRGLQQGQRVSYRVADSERGPQAEDVQVMGDNGGERTTAGRGAAPRRRRG